MVSKLYVGLILAFTSILLSSCISQSPNTNYELLHSSSKGFINIEKGKLFYQKFGSGEPIIVAHGGPGLDQQYLLPQLTQLASNHEVVLYDQRGSGNSTNTPINVEYINIHQFTKDLECLRKQLGYKKFILMGHSWGGLLAMNYAKLYPNHLSSLILVGTAPASYQGQQKFMEEIEQKSTPIRHFLEPLSSYELFKELNEKEIAQLYKKLFSIYFYKIQDVEKLTLRFPEKYADKGFRVHQLIISNSWLQPKTDLLSKLTNLNVPTLIIHGREDIIPLWTAEEIKNTIPKAEILILDKCGHFPYVEQPVLFFKGIKEFLRK